MTKPKAQTSAPSVDRIRDYLVATPPVGVLSASDQLHLASIARHHAHAKGETIYVEGQGSTSAWVLLKGRLEIFKYTSGGKSTAIESLGPHQWFGTFCRIGCHRTTYPCTAIAAMDSETLSINDDEFWKLLDRAPAFLRGICSACSLRLNTLQEFAVTTQEPADKRIIKTLLRLSEENGLTLPFSKREVSDLASTAPETAIRVLNCLERKGWITSARGKITLTNIDHLRKYLQ